jgi:hypothetical protein
MASTFLKPEQYSVRLNETMRSLGGSATIDKAKETLAEQGIYKDTEANRKKFGK